MVYYQANPDCPFFPELRGLLLKTAGLVDVLRDALKPLAAKIAFRRKRQFSFGLGRQRRAWPLKQLWDRALAW